MTYLYESLSPERFQHFCQALIVSSFPNAQCLPVAQPDGGRDAFVWRANFTVEKERELFVFQVKFGRTATDREEGFIEDICKNEAPKVKRLIQKGARVAAYYLLTNIQGTAHPDVGSIDRMNAALSACLEVPAFCWWRDDLDRRVDASTNIKWSFPEIIRGSDLLQALMQGTVGEDGRRRDDAIRAYLASQYDDDKEVKFKQVDLYNSLLDLFIDVPILHLESHEPSQRWVSATRFVGQDNGQFFIEEAAGAADLLLSWNTSLGPSRIVLELGA